MHLGRVSHAAVLHAAIGGASFGEPGRNRQQRGAARSRIVLDDLSEPDPAVRSYSVGRRPDCLEAGIRRGRDAVSGCHRPPRRHRPARNILATIHPESLALTPTITAFEQSPDRGRGLARDMRVRWALEEVGQPYDVRLVSFSQMKESEHRALHPFGQIPTYEEGDLTLFESGPSCSISRSIMRACCQTTRMPGRARSAWMFAALNTVEPPIADPAAAALLERDKSLGTRSGEPILQGRVRDRLGRTLPIGLAMPTGSTMAASCQDLLMVTVLRQLGSSGILEDLSEPLRLCRLQPGAACLQAGFRRSSWRFSPATSAAGLHRGPRQICRARPAQIGSRTRLRRILPGGAARGSSSTKSSPRESFELRRVGGREGEDFGARRVAGRKARLQLNHRAHLRRTRRGARRSCSCPRPRDA